MRLKQVAHGSEIISARMRRHVCRLRTLWRHSFPCASLLKKAKFVLCALITQVSTRASLLLLPYLQLTLLMRLSKSHRVEDSFIVEAACFQLLLSESQNRLVVANECPLATKRAHLTARLNTTRSKLAAYSKTLRLPLLVTLVIHLQSSSKIPR